MTELNSTITTVEDLKFALKNVNPKTQIYARIDDGTLIEITDILCVLPKNNNDEPYIILSTDT